MAAGWMFAAALYAHAETYSVVDAGGFGSTGRFVEFDGNYGWSSYEARFDFTLDSAGRSVEKARLDLTVLRRDGGRWSYRCRPSDGDLFAHARVNNLYGQGVSVLVECRVEPKRFARSVGLAPEFVGEPVLVFQALIRDGRAQAGRQKGFYFLTSESSVDGPLSPYLSAEADPSNLAVLFNGEDPASSMASTRTVPRFIP